MTSEVVVAIAAAIPGVVAAIVSYINHRRIQEVHILVNSKMTEALDTIAKLRDDAATTALVAAAKAHGNVDDNKNLPS